MGTTNDDVIARFDTMAVELGKKLENIESMTKGAAAQASDAAKHSAKAATEATEAKSFADQASKHATDASKAANKAAEQSGKAHEAMRDVAPVVAAHDREMLLQALRNTSPSEVKEILGKLEKDRWENLPWYTKLGEIAKAAAIPLGVGIGAGIIGTRLVESRMIRAGAASEDVTLRVVPGGRS